MSLQDSAPLLFFTAMFSHAKKQLYFFFLQDSNPAMSLFIERFAKYC